MSPEAEALRAELEDLRRQARACAEFTWWAYRLSEGSQTGQEDCPKSWSEWRERVWKAMPESAQALVCPPEKRTVREVQRVQF